jgi:hypothetical protein
VHGRRWPGIACHRRVAPGQGPPGTTPGGPQRTSHPYLLKRLRLPGGSPSARTRTPPGRRTAGGPAPCRRQRQNAARDTRSSAITSSIVSSGSPGVPGSSAGVAGGRPGAVGVPGTAACGAGFLVRAMVVTSFLILRRNSRFILPAPVFSSRQLLWYPSPARYKPGPRQVHPRRRYQPCDSSNQVTVRPPRRRRHPHRVASPATSCSPRPPSASRPAGRGSGTPGPLRSVTSTRTVLSQALTATVTVSPAAPEPLWNVAQFAASSNQVTVRRAAATPTVRQGGQRDDAPGGLPLHHRQGAAPAPLARSGR